MQRGQYSETPIVKMPTLSRWVFRKFNPPPLFFFFSVWCSKLFLQKVRSSAYRSCTGTHISIVLFDKLERAVKGKQQKLSMICLVLVLSAVHIAFLYPAYFFFFFSNFVLHFDVEFSFCVIFSECHNYSKIFFDSHLQEDTKTEILESKNTNLQTDATSWFIELFRLLSSPATC